LLDDHVAGDDLRVVDDLVDGLDLRAGDVGRVELVEAGPYGRLRLGPGFDEFTDVSPVGVAAFEALVAGVGGQFFAADELREPLPRLVYLSREDEVAVRAA